jgi:quinone-modifying oxidoreductase subunit QmoC
LSERAKLGNDIEFIRHLQKHGGDTMKKCFQCATCSVACELSPKEHAFPRKEMINASWGLKDKLMADPDIWLCHGCMDCSQQCPRGARPADLMAALRSYVYRHYAVPSFMGKALSESQIFTCTILSTNYFDFHFE